MIKFLMQMFLLWRMENLLKKNTQILLKDKKVVIFGLPGAYTSICSGKTSPRICEHV
jgi:peroxiredoxin